MAAAGSPLNGFAKCDTNVSSFLDHTDRVIAWELTIFHVSSNSFSRLKRVYLEELEFREGRLSRELTRLMRLSRS